MTHPDAALETKRQEKTMLYIMHRIIDVPRKPGSDGTDRLHLLVHGPGGCGKSFVLRAAAHKLRSHGHGVIIAAYTGTAAFNVGGVTLHQCCALPVTNKSYGQHAVDAIAPQGAQLQNLREVWAFADVLFVDEISMVSSELLKLMDRNLKLARKRPDFPFGGIHFVAFGDLYQLPPPKDLPAYAATHLWMLFELIELAGNHWAARDPAWATLLGRVRVGAWTQEDITTLKRRVSRKPASTATHLFATRAAVQEANSKRFEIHMEQHARDYHCPASDTYISSAAESPPANAYPRPEDTGGLEQLLRVAIDARVMLRLNLDVSDGLSNGARGYVYDITEKHAEVQKIWVKFDKGGQRWRDAHQHPDAVAIERHTARFYGKDGQAVQRRQFPLMLSWAETIHKSQGATHHGGVHVRLDASVRMPAQAYVALSRSPTMALLTLSAFNPKCLVTPKGAEWALNELLRVAASRPQPKSVLQQKLYNELVRPAHPAEHYDQRAAEIGPPDWEEHRRFIVEHSDEVRAEATWTCPFCGTTGASKDEERKHLKACRRSQKTLGAPSKSSMKKAKPSQTTMPTAKPEPRPAAKKKARQAITTTVRSAPKPPLPPPTEPPPPTASVPLFFQRQPAGSATCGMHALNNAIGEDIFSPD